MSTPMLCRLCIRAHTEFKSLYNDFEQGNEVYDITVKYFDPMFINSQQYPQLSKNICLNCWQHIYDFHNFQQSVVAAQVKLEEDLKQIITDIKLEDSSLTEVQLITDNPSTDNGIGFDNNEFCLSQLDIIDVKNEDYCLGEKDQQNELLATDLMEVIPKRTRNSRVRKVKIKDVIEKKKTSTKCTKSRKKNISKKTALKTEKQKKNHTAKDFNFFENSNNSSNLSFNYNDNVSVSDNDTHFADPDAFTYSNDKQKSVKEKRSEIDAFIAEWKQCLECELCHENFTNLTLLRKHFSTEHPQQKCYVSCCQRKLTQRLQIVEHIRYHMDSNAFKCSVCEKVFLNSRNLNYHIRDQHTAENKERSFECSICKKGFFKKGALKSHIETHDTDKTFKCSQCEKGFPTEQRRKIHERTVHNVDRVCDQCGKTIHGIAALKQHMLEHAGVKKQKWPCDQCNAQLTSHFSLKRHKTIHDTSTVYMCNECGKTASTHMALQSHKKYAHQLERKFKCTICEKAFKVAHVLREHMATHTGVDLYKCPYCPQTFKVNANMHHHRKKVHPKEWAEDRVNKVFRSKSSYENLDVV